MLLAFGYCTPGGVFIGIYVPMNNTYAYYTTGIILVFIGVLVAASTRGPRAAARTAELMISALVLGFVINAVIFWNSL